MTGVEQVKEAAALYRKADGLLSGGPLSFYLEKMATAYDYLMEHCCPFRIGDRVELVKNVELREGSGWKRSEHFLVQGSKATVQSLDFSNGNFVAYVSFDDDSWINSSDGSINPTPHSCTFGFRASSLRVVRDAIPAETPARAVQEDDGGLLACVTCGQPVV